MRKSWNLSGFKVLHFGKCERRIFYFSMARWAKCNTAQFYNFILLVFVCWGCVITGRGHDWTELVMKEEGCAHWECARLLARSRKDEQDPKWSAGKRKTALVGGSCGRKAAIVGIPHEKVGIRARMRSASIVRVGRIAILAAWDSVCFIIPRRAEGKQKRMVGSTMICLSYLARASICFPFTEQIAPFLCHIQIIPP